MRVKMRHTQIMSVDGDRITNFATPEMIRHDKFVSRVRSSFVGVIYVFGKRIELKDEQELAMARKAGFQILQR